jgi:hypothetical protein
MVKTIGIVVAACVGCTKVDRPTKAESEPATRPSAQESKPGPAVAPSPGKLTADAIMQIEDNFVESYDPWDTAFTKLQTRLGPPTKIDGDTYYWAAVTNGVCAQLEVEKIDGKQANMSGTLLRTMDPRGLRPLHYGPNDALVNRDQCLELARAR